MKGHNGFGSSWKCANINFDQIIHRRKTLTDSISLIEKAYHAGMITRYGELVIYGTGAERGTWGQFANVHVEGIDMFNARTALTWFADIYSLALRNQGTSVRKRNFYLSQLQEIDPLLKAFGLSKEFEEKWLEVEIHDLEHDLPNEWNSRGRIASWETRTKKETIRFQDREAEILDAVTSHIINDPNAVPALQGVPRPSELIGNAFIEGTRGLTMSTDDLNNLMRNGRVAA